MFTHKDYVIAGKCTHQQYYAQFVTEEIRIMVVLNLGLDTLKQAYQEDKAFNTIPLSCNASKTHILEIENGIDSCE